MLKLSYILTNRGRANKSVLSVILDEIENNEHFILLLDESDATDADKGLDGREIFELVRKNTKDKDIKIYTDDNLDVGTGFITSKSLKVIKQETQLINKWDLKFPQGSSERYKHFRSIIQFEFTKDLAENLEMPGINIVSQHNSAFIRPLRRAIQSFTAMTILKSLQSKQNDRLSFLIRDQNTMFPGEGKIERFLRYINKVKCLTDSITHYYNTEFLESDTGGLNAFWVKLYKSGVVDFISNHIVTLADKIESISIIKEKSNLFNMDFIPESIRVDKLDHGMLSITLKSKLTSI